MAIATFETGAIPASDAQPRDGIPAARIFWQTAIAVLALAPLTYLAMLGEERLLNGINLWIKPLKFQLSVAVHMATLAVLTSLAAASWRDGWLLRVTAWATVAATAFEIAYITGQAARGEHSHFNVDTPLESAMYALMGIGAVTLIAAALILGIVILRRPAAGLAPGLRWGAGLGLILSFVLTLIVAGYMSSSGSHWVGGTGTDAGGLPVTGWARDGGDLRVPHFFATHMMQVLPVVGWAADRWTRRPVAAVLAAAVLGCLVTGVTFAQALMGLPVL